MEESGQVGAGIQPYNAEKAASDRSTRMGTDHSQGRCLKGEERRLRPRVLQVASSLRYGSVRLGLCHQKAGGRRKTEEGGSGGAEQLGEFPFGRRKPGCNRRAS